MLCRKMPASLACLGLGGGVGLFCCYDGGNSATSPLLHFLELGQEFYQPENLGVK